MREGWRRPGWPIFPLVHPAVVLCGFVEYALQLVNVHLSLLAFSADSCRQLRGAGLGLLSPAFGSSCSGGGWLWICRSVPQAPACLQLAGSLSGCSICAVGIGVSPYSWNQVSRRTRCGGRGPFRRRTWARGTWHTLLAGPSTRGPCCSGSRSWWPVPPSRGFPVLL